MLYQYKKFNQNTISSLMLNTIWFSTPDMFNDPYDSHVRFYYHGSIDSWINFLTTTLPWAKNPASHIKKAKQDLVLFESQFNERNTPLNNIMRVSCFSESPKNFLMWSHYAEFHKGICIGYETFKTSTNDIQNIQIDDKDIEVLEKNNKQYIPVKKITYEDKIQYEFNQLTQSTEDLARLMFLKGKIWKYEKEWRSLHRYTEKEKIHLSQNSIESICMGSKMSINDENLLFEVVKTLNIKRTKKIKLYKIYLSEKTNKLAMKRCKY